MDAEKSWLKLSCKKDSNSSGNPAVSSDGHVRHGTLDVYPDLPAGYDGILVESTPEFFRWCRWYFQDLARQLKPGGVLRMEAPPIRVGKGSNRLIGLKQACGAFRWKAAVWCENPWLQNHLLPKGVVDQAVRAGLRLVPELGAREFPGPKHGVVCFQKSDAYDPADVAMDGDDLEKLFIHHFGSWLDGGIKPDNWPKVPSIRASDLLADNSPSKVLVLAPHPDDELIGCGGTLLALAEAGAEIHVLHMTEGMTCLALSDAGEAERRSIRWQEAAAVANKFGFTGHYWESGVTGGLEATQKNCDRLMALIESLRPTIIFVPAHTDHHPEHQLAHQIFSRVRESIPKCTRVLEYPVWGLLPDPNLAVEVTTRYPEVLDALYLYKTAMKAENYVIRCQVLADYHGYRQSSHSGRAIEVFKLLHGV